MMASWYGHESIVEALIKHGADVNDEDEVKTYSTILIRNPFSVHLNFLWHRNLICLILL